MSAPASREVCQGHALLFMCNFERLSDAVSMKLISKFWFFLEETMLNKNYLVSQPCYVMQDSQAAPLFLRGLSEAQLTAEFRFCHDLASEFLQRDGKFSEFSRPQRLGESHEWLAEGVLATHRTHNHRRHSLGRYRLLEMDFSSWLPWRCIAQLNSWRSSG